MKKITNKEKKEIKETLEIVLNKNEYSEIITHILNTTINKLNRDLNVL